MNWFKEIKDDTVQNLHPGMMVLSWPNSSPPLQLRSVSLASVAGV